MPISLVVETGAVVSGANCFVDLATADAYFALRANATWAAATTAAKEAAIIRGADFLCQAYRFKGARYQQTQALCWPRIGVSDGDGRAIAFNVIPQALRDANCEAALRALGGDLAPDETKEVVRKSVAGAVDTTYRAGSPAKTYPVIDRLLAGLVQGGGLSVVLA
ncbi:MAG: hypothetical protein LDL11_06635 [Desulfarculus sp.]|nr:hypothetical protein [Desulfarculus sp.]